MTTQAERVPNRWGIAAAGIVMQMVLGTVYAWSVFKKPFMDAHHWSGPEVGLAFTLMIFVLGLSAALGGRFVDTAGARKVATIAAVLFGIGTLLGGLADSLSNKWILWIGYGVIGGIGNGLGYVTPIAVLVRWFPDRRGLITGMAVMGFGFGAAIMGQIAPLVVPKIGLAMTFYAFGAVFLVVLLFAAQKFVNPPAGWSPPGMEPKKAQASASAAFHLGGALRTYQFYLLWGILFLNVTAGIGLISNMSPMAQQQVGMSAVAAGTVVLLSSLCNGFGRIFWAAVSDKIGRKSTFLILLGSQVPVVALLPSVTNGWLFAALCCYVLLCYGGGFGTMPAFTADTFGPKNIGRIYGKILLAWGCAGVVGPMLMELIQKRSGNFATALHIAAGLLCVGALLAALYRKPKAPGTEAP